MAQFRFNADGRRRGRRRFAGALVEPTPATIRLPFDEESLRVVLGFGLESGHAVPTHQAIAHWCEKAALEWIEADVFHKAASVAGAVGAQWDLMLANWPGGLAALDGVEADQVRMPAAWFSAWITELSAPVTQ